MHNSIIVASNRLRSIIFFIAVSSSCAQSLPNLTFSPGVISTIAGSGISDYSGDNGPALAATFRDPSGLAIGAGYLYIADTANNVIRRVNMSDSTVSTVAGTGVPNYAGDGGAATDAALHSPLSVALDLAGNLLIADTYNNVIRKVDAEGQITTVAGNTNGTIGLESSNRVGDGSAATDAVLWHPSSLAVDRSGNIYIADTYHHRIRKVDATTQIITTIAGNGIGGYSRDGSDASSTASLNLPSSLAVNSEGIVVADANNVVRWIDNSTHVITTIAGGGSTPGNDTLGDGSLATGASFLNPMGLAFDTTGRMLFVSDSFHSLVRQIDTKTWQTTVVAGIDPSRRALAGSIAPPSSTNSPLDTDIDVPVGIASDASGNLYFVDSGHDVVRKLSFSTGSLVIYGGVGTSSSQTVRVNNTGGPALALSFALVGNSDFALSNNNCPVQLPSGENCQVTVSFSSHGENATGSLFILNEGSASSNPTTLGNVMITGTVSAEHDSNTCQYTLVDSATQLPYSEGVSQQPIFITTGASCNWTANSDSSWLVINGETSGTGNGSISYTVAPNLSGSARFGTISLENQSLSIMQLGNPATLPVGSAPKTSSCSAVETGAVNASKHSGKSVHSFLITEPCQR